MLDTLCEASSQSTVLCSISTLSIQPRSSDRFDSSFEFDLPLHIPRQAPWRARCKRINGGMHLLTAVHNAQPSRALTPASCPVCCIPCNNINRGRAAESRAKEAIYGGYGDEGRPITPNRHGKKSAFQVCDQGWCCCRSQGVHAAADCSTMCCSAALLFGFSMAAFTSFKPHSIHTTQTS